MSINVNIVTTGYRAAKVVVVVVGFFLEGGGGVRRGKTMTETLPKVCFSKRIDTPFVCSLELTKLYCLF